MKFFWVILKIIAGLATSRFWCKKSYISHKKYRMMRIFLYYIKKGLSESVYSILYLYFGGGDKLN